MNSSIPAIEQMAEYNNWVLYNDRKVPLKVDGRGAASSTDPSTWTGYARAKSSVGSVEDAVGVGFALSETPIVCIDIDHGVDEQGETRPEAETIINFVDSFTEVSKSGNGFHIFVWGELPEGWSGHQKDLGNGVSIEVYESGRYIAMTENVYEGRDTIQQRSLNLAKLGYDHGFLNRDPIVVLDSPEPSAEPVTDLPAFPLDVLPHTIREFVLAVAASTNTPVDAVAFSTFGTAAAIAGPCMTVCIEPGWELPCSLYMATVMPTGAGKSPIFRHTTKPIYELERELQEDAAPVVAEARAQEIVLREREKLLRKDAGRTTPNSREAEIATSDLVANEQKMKELEHIQLPRLVCGDVTSEKLVQLMSCNNGQIAIVDDDAVLFANASGRYSDGKPRLEVFLHAHSGRPIHVDRVTRDGNAVEKPRLAILVAAQPCVIESLGNKPELLDRGFVGRFLFCFPKSNVGWRDLSVARPLDADVAEKYNTLMVELGQLVRRDPDGISLAFSNEARERFISWRADIERRRRPDGDLFPVIAFASKLEGTIGRVAALIEALDRELGAPISSTIGLQSIERAILLLEFFIAHAQVGNQHIVGDPNRRLATKIYEWATSRNATSFSLRDCQRGPGSRKKKAQVLEALELLQDDGLVEIVEAQPEKGGSPTIWVTLVSQHD